MGSYLGAIWHCRYFWLALVKMDLRTRYRGSMLGIGWSLLQPLAMTVIFCVAFSGILNTNFRTYAPHLVIGLTCWQFLLTVTLEGCNCFRNAESYIRQHPAPLAIYPLRTVLGGGFHFLMALAVSVVVISCISGPPRPLHLAMILPGILLLGVLCWSLAVLGGLATVHFPDTRHLIEVGFNALFYLSPIMYIPKMWERAHLLQVVLAWNPLTYFLLLFRDPLIDGHHASPTAFLIAASTTLVAAAAAVLALNRLERRLIFYL